MSSNTVQIVHNVQNVQITQEELAVAEMIKKSGRLKRRGRMGRKYHPYEYIQREIQAAPKTTKNFYVFTLQDKSFALKEPKEGDYSHIEPIDPDKTDPGIPEPQLKGLKDYDYRAVLSKLEKVKVPVHLTFCSVFVYICLLLIAPCVLLYFLVDSPVKLFVIPAIYAFTGFLFLFICSLQFETWYKKKFSRRRTELNKIVADENLKIRNKEFRWMMSIHGGFVTLTRFGKYEKLPFLL
jgi:hypothetical protein